MIKFSLKCGKGHRFESWFGSNDDFEMLKSRNLVTCSICGSDAVSKAIMAPRIAADPSETEKPLSRPQTPAEQALRELRHKIESESEDVGTAFATEARKIHDGEAPNRSIIGEARPEEAKALLEDGIEVMPLPWLNKEVN